MDEFLPFEEKFLNSLPQNFYGKRILLAVSGGADSVAMLVCMHNLCKKTKIKICVVTVNHKIRPNEESAGDCDFVFSLCNSLGVECKIIEAQDGEIFQFSEKRKKGIEEAARFFRYDAIKTACSQLNCSAVFLAHNKNDQEETLLQRFLQGSFRSSSCGIPLQRQLNDCVFFRPLLNFSRSEILEYLKLKNISYRIDKTNFDTSYFRNRIRNILIPTLNENFSGWNTAILNSAQKKKIDEDFFDSVLENYEWKYELKSDDNAFVDNNALQGSVLSIDEKKFDSLHLSLKIRLIYKALEILECEERISYENIKKFCLGSNVCTCSIKLRRNKNKVFVEQNKNQLKNSGKSSVLFAIIEDETDFCLGDYRVSVLHRDDDKKLTDANFVATLPFSIEILNGKIKIEEWNEKTENEHKKVKVQVWKEK